MSASQQDNRPWNGWGDKDKSLALSADGIAYIKRQVGTAPPLANATLEQALASVPESKLAPNPLYSLDRELRLRHARGQSLPDWLAMKSGRFEVFPDAVAFPRSSEEIRQLMTAAKQQGWQLIPYGGGTSVVGHITPCASDKPIVTVSLSKINRLLDLDRVDQIATFGAGVNGPFLEAQLQAHGYTLGHFPQSFELSTLGGWVVTRSSGQQSLKYGRIENLFAGGQIETFNGSVDIPTLPASSAGPDWRQLVLGSEGHLGILTEAKVKISRLPEEEFFGVAFMPNWQQGIDCAREIIQQRLPLSMLRVSNTVETTTQLFLSASESQRQWLSRLLKLRGVGDDKCMLVYGITGDKRANRAHYRQLKRLLRQFGGVNTGQHLGKKWAQKRFTFPYLRETLWQMGYAIDTLETATNWSNVAPLTEKIESSLRSGLEPFGSKAHVFTHLSHLYGDGASIYTTYLFPVADSYDETYRRWQRLKQSTSRLIVDNNATISHQHGVGADHAPYLPREKGEHVITSLRHCFDYFDPEQQLNPGKLFKALDNTPPSSTSEANTHQSSSPDASVQQELQLTESSQ
ncbi:alkyldihydroxyacetonephosphate synthase [Sinobacterium caligoides]|uniref:Alkyldihydroxyacetonephosphate synthase n=1 Tax=Sinobacterium caligoides TaxID=933926 RepID=A0A3N2DZV2_9GAMM|nr:FAD-binding oxidoreductase [Sinobacterium caligoides]ROS05364.1 alkyldihydroxyacetonephosphate synthase [Sinobacterium caligoides]